MKKNGAKETRHLVAMAKPEFTACGRPVGKVLLWAKKAPPAFDDKTVCGRCRVLTHGLPAAEKTTLQKSQEKGARRTEKIRAQHEAIREAGTPKAPRATGKRIPSLQFLGDRMPRTLEVVFKGVTHQADVIQDEGVATGAVRGTIRIGNDLFNSPSRAGKAVAGREVDGWTFWSYLKADGTLAKLDALRKAVAR